MPIDDRTTNKSDTEMQATTGHNNDEKLGDAVKCSADVERLKAAEADFQKELEEAEGKLQSIKRQKDGLQAQKANIENHPPRMLFGLCVNRKALSVLQTPFERELGVLEERQASLEYFLSTIQRRAEYARQQLLTVEIRYTESIEQTDAGAADAGPEKEADSP